MKPVVPMAVVGILIVAAASVLLFILPASSSDTAAARPNRDDLHRPEFPCKAFSREMEQAGSAFRPDRRKVDPPPGDASPSVQTPFSGWITDSRSGGPVESAGFWLRRFDEEASELGLGIYFASRDREGRFSIQLEKGGEYQVCVVSSSHLTRMIKDLEIPDGKGRTGLHVELDPGLSVAGRVVEEKTGKAVEGALVGAGNMTDLSKIRSGRPDCTVHTITDEEGRFVLSGLYSTKQAVVAAIHPRFAEGFAKTVPGCGEEIEIDLKPGFQVYGTAYDDRGDPLPGLVVRVVDPKRAPLAIETVTGPDGRYRTAPVHCGEFNVLAGFPWGAAMGKKPFTRENRRVEMKDGDVRVDFGKSGDFVTWRGSVIGVGGVLPDSCCVAAWQREPYSDSTVTFLTRHDDCDRSGRFELHKLVPGLYDLEIWCDGQESFSCGEISIETPGLQEQDIEIPGAAIRGKVINGLTGLPVEAKDVTITAHGTTAHEEWYETDLSKSGRFTLWGLVPGRYRITAEGPEIVDTAIEGILVAEGRFIDGLSIVVPASGRLQLRIADFGLDEWFDFDLTLRRQSRKMKCDSVPEIGSGEDWVESWCLEAGSWEVELNNEELGSVRRSVMIYAGEMTEVTVRHSDFPADAPSGGGR